MLRDRYPADGVSQLTRSNQWLIRPLQLQIKIVRDPSSCPPPLPASNDSANWTGPQPQTGDLNYYGWKLRPVGSSLVSFARVLFQLRPVSSYLSPSLVSISSIFSQHCSLSPSVLWQTWVLGSPVTGLLSTVCPGALLAKS